MRSGCPPSCLPGRPAPRLGSPLPHCASPGRTTCACVCVCVCVCAHCEVLWCGDVCMHYAAYTRSMCVHVNVVCVHVRHEAKGEGEGMGEGG